MKAAKKKLLGTFEQKISFSLSPEVLEESLKLLNLHNFNDKECNHYINGKLVAKYPSLETKEVKEAYWRVNAGTVFTVAVELYSDGSYEVVRKNKNEKSN